MKQTHTTDILICGAGIIGLTLCRELLKRGCGNITIIEKEPAVAYHASGRNSGVLHAGIYYAPETMKAAYCLEGNHLLKEYCRAEDLPLEEKGKVIVTQNEDEEKTLQDLYQRAGENGTPVQIIDKEELHDIEPGAKTFHRALFSPETAVCSPRDIMAHLASGLEHDRRVTILYETSFRGFDAKKKARTNRGTIAFDYFINAAGAYSDRIAHARGLGKRYRLVPFKGTYYRLRAKASPPVRGNIYPVPDIRNPFLGVHFTRSTGGEVYIGPTAIPAFGRENYRHLEGIGTEALAILFTDASLFFTNRGFRSVALTEPLKYFKTRFFHDASRLVHNLSRKDILPSPKRGIRPQLIDTKEHTLIMDFVLAEDESSLHILNAISPAFTASMSFARIVADRVEKAL